MFDNIIGYYVHKINEADRRAGMGENIEEYEHQCLEVYSHTLESILTAKAMLEAEGSGMRGGMSFADGRGGSSNGMSYGNSYGYSYADNRMPNMGNSYRGGYSRADRMDAVVDSVNGAMADMPADMQREAQTFLNRMQQARMNAR